eukprot:TRINITY_DN2164_c0_g1_i1.p1 TRINITY_DN2164_c0_g1~~TRINITY_DN2164_c0_g1_i1.p1  ORF type:complete len:168 (+),score=44.81 TRINITY_DN2164_c0_g1_i1:120-623(+)
MLVYQDLISGDEMLSDSFEANEIYNGIFFEVEGKWVVKGAVDVDIGANPSAEGGEDEAVEDSAEKVVDIVDTFRLQEQPPFDKKSFAAYLKGYVQKLAGLIPAERGAQFRADSPAAVKWLMSKLADLQFFVGESMNNDGSMAFAYYKEGGTNPTFIYFKDGLKEVKC